VAAFGDRLFFIVAAFNGKHQVYLKNSTCKDPNLCGHTIFEKKLNEFTEQMMF